MLRRAAGSLPGLAWIAAADLSCRFVNDRWAHWTGRTAEDALGNGWLECVHEDDRDALVQAAAEAASRREELRAEARILDAHGLDHWFLFAASPQMDPDGKVEGWVGTCLDVNERKQH